MLSTALLMTLGFFTGARARVADEPAAMLFNTDPFVHAGESEFLRKAAQACNLHISSRRDRHVVSGNALGEILARCFDPSGLRCLPREVTSYGRTLLPTFLMGLRRATRCPGEHTATDNGAALIHYTTSSGLESQLSEIALKAGGVAEVDVVADESTRRDMGCEPASPGPARLFRVTCTQHHLMPRANAVGSAGDDSWEEYEGLIYCADLPSHHTLYVRRNGRPVWAGE